jgi:serine/threonine protein kinase/formylglycine-generating enzyme required for sulfatase activity
MPESIDTRLPQTSDWQSLQEMVDRFQKAWREAVGSATEVDLSGYLPPPDNPFRQVALHQLTKLDLASRWERGQAVTLDFYLAKYPELGPARELPPALIYEEYRVRHLHGDREPPAAYQSRFPEQFAQLLQMIQEHPSLRSDLEPRPSPAPETAAPAAAPTLPNCPVLQVVGDYRLIRCIGAGAYGQVWEAEAPGGSEVAVKVISHSLEKRAAQQELAALEYVKRLRHPYLVQTHAYYAQDQRLYIVMDLADCSLNDRVRRCQEEGLPGLPPDELLRYFREAAEALDYLHAQGVHHRDIKPGNLLLLQGHIKVADFGLARPLQNQASLVDATAAGTPSFMAPEVWEDKVSKHSDQWSLAVAYAELRLGRQLFKSSNLIRLSREIRRGPPDLSPLPAAEQKVLRKALHVNPSRRHGSCRKFVEALEEALRPEPPPESRPGPAPEPRRPWLVKAAVLALLLLLPAALVAYRVSQRDRGQPVQPRLEVSVPVSLQLDAGTTTNLPLHVDRHDFPGPVRVFCPEPPPGVEVPEDELAAGAGAVTLRVTAGPKAVRGVHKVTLSAGGGGVQASAVVELTVLVVPPGCEKDSDKVVHDAQGVPYYQTISRVLADGTRVPFLLVPRKPAGECRAGKPDPVPTFYVMRDKVSLSLFRRFAAGHKQWVPTAGWALPLLRQQVGAWGVLGSPAAPGPLLAVSALAGWDENDSCPVLDVTVEEAAAFAEVWLGGLLPTVEQWDKAAGCHARDRGEGPYVGAWDRWELWLGARTWGLLGSPAAPGPLAAASAPCPGAERLVRPDVAVYPYAPRPVGTARDDVSPFGCRDMAGNGYEWTRDLSGRTQKVPLPRGVPRNDVWVVLRGRGFRTGDDRPLTYLDLEGESRTFRYVDPLGDGGFRVVIEP